MNLPESYQKATRMIPVRSLPSKELKTIASSTKHVTQLPAKVTMITEEIIERCKWNSRDAIRRFKACFGASNTIVADIWNRIVDRGPSIESSGEPKHLLRALIHLRVYSTVEIHCSITRWPSAKTSSKWAWSFIEQIADLKDGVICLGNRFDSLNEIATTNCFISCFISVDGTDCPAYEQWAFSQQMYLHKLNGPGVKYKVGVCLKTGWIVWINGPFVGSGNDATIYKEGSSTLLHDNEGVEVDQGYKGDDKMKLPDMGMTSKQRKMKANARAQHERVNDRLKIFNVLTTHFRHVKPNRQGMMQKHGMCFNAVAVITQLKFAIRETTFEDGLDYDVSYF
eukprot:jgi/Psemu1/176/gm1.176_g